jgi:hypothetical protein
MSYTTADIRENFRDTIGYTKYLNGEDCSTVSVNDDFNDKIYVPLYFPDEVRTGDLPPFPFIEMTLVSSPTEQNSIGGDRRDMDVYFDLNIYCVKRHGITPNVFIKRVCDELVDLIMTYNNSVSGCYYVEVINDGREIIEEEEGKSVVFHRVMECHVKNFS